MKKIISRLTDNENNFHSPDIKDTFKPEWRYCSDMNLRHCYVQH